MRTPPDEKPGFVGVGQAGERVERDRMAGEYYAARHTRQRVSRVELDLFGEPSCCVGETVVLLPAMLRWVLYSARASLRRRHS